MQQINAQASDLLLRVRGKSPSSAARDIVLLAIDDGTARRHGPLPLKRSVLTQGLTMLAAFEPRLVAIDILLAERGEPDQDQALAGGVQALPEVILGVAMENDPGASSRWIRPLPELEDASKVAHVHAEPDADGVVRSVLLAKAAEGRRYWALGLEAAAVAWQAGRPVETQDALRLGAVFLPASAGAGRLLRINYAGPEGTFDRISFASLLDGSAEPETFRGRIVILGVTAQGGGDRHFTPVSSGIGMSGIEIHANIVRTILDRTFLVPLSVFGEVALFLSIITASVLVAMRLRGVRLAGSLMLAGVAIPVLSYLALSQGSVWPLGSLLAVLFASATVAGAAEYATVALALQREEHKRREHAFRVQAVAHEIKSPLAAIQGSSEIISDRSLPEQTRLDMAGLIHKESRRLNTLLRTFVEVERLAAGSLPVEKSAVDLAALCGEILGQARLYAARKNIDIRSDVPPLTLQADNDLLSFAVYNLLTNAVKYSPKNTTVVVSAAQSGGGVAITVADQGYGIEPAEQQRIFERFYRLRRDEKGAEEGSGIGLALVKEIVSQHGGRIEVVSRPNQGSRFTIFLPHS